MKFKSNEKTMVLGKRKKFVGKFGKKQTKAFGKKGKRQSQFQSSNKKQKWPSSKNDEELSSLSESSGSETEEENEEVKSDVEELQEETPLEKKMRLAKAYIDELKQLKEEEVSDDDNDHRDFVGEKLKEDILEQSGRLQRSVAADCKVPRPDFIQTLKTFRKSVVCIVVSEDSKYIYTAAKDCAISKWCLKTRAKLVVVKGGRKFKYSHSDHILSLAVSSDGKYLASGGKDNLVIIWRCDKLTRVHIFKGHRNAVTGLAFRRNSQQLFSISADRTVKVWNLEVMGYVETLYGHQDGIQACDSFYKDRCLTAGGRDGSVRVWKIPEESQLVYHGHGGSIDCIRYINENHLISGADDGSICVWSLMRKKPICVLPKAHGLYKENGNPRWICSVAALSNSDLVATGSNDGQVRLWKCSNRFHQLTLIFEIPVCGFVNDLRFTEDGSYLMVAVGQEHKLGRWWTIKEARNTVVIVPILST